MPRKNDCLRRQSEQFVEAVIEGLGTQVCLINTGIEIRTPDVTPASVITPETPLARIRKDVRAR